MAFNGGEGRSTPSMPFDSGALAWSRLCQKTAALGVAFAEFKLALDDYALMERGGELSTNPDISGAEGTSTVQMSRNADR